MGALYIDRKNVELRLDGRRIRVIESGKPTSTMPVALLDEVVIQRSASLDSRVLLALAEQGASLVVVDARRPGRVACLTGTKDNVAGRRLAQYATASNEPWRNAWSRRLVRRKIRSQMRLVARAITQRPDKRLSLGKALRTLADAVASLDEHKESTRASIRGIEGAASAAYFRAYRELFAPALAFQARNRRPPRDPVNACLSLGYTLIHADAVRATRAAGLDPLIGFYHDLAFGRDSLACDLTEPLRPRIDEWVWGLFRKRVMRPEAFSTSEDRCMLGKAGRTRYYAAYHRMAPVIHRQLRRTLRVLTLSMQAVEHNAHIARGAAQRELKG